MQARPMPSCGVCLSVCPSDTFVNSLETNKYIFIFFHCRVSTNYQAFLYQTLWQYSDGDSPTGASNAGGVAKNRDSQPISDSIACCERFGRQVQYTQLRRTMTS